MSFLLSSYVRVTNPNLKSYNAVGVVHASGFTKTSVQLPSGSVIEFLNHNLEYHKPTKAETVSSNGSSFQVGDVVESRGGNQAKVTRVHSLQSGEYLNVEFIGTGYPQVQTWRAEGIKLISRAEQAVYKESFAPPQQPSKEETGTFILWSPQSNKPPKVVHTTRSQAYEAQKAMAERYPNQEFFIMKAVSKMRMERKVELRPVVTEY
ncbi:MAG: hypothetical protein AAFN81_10800 [Bacteroidota bacterium]